MSFTLNTAAALLPAGTCYPSTAQGMLNLVTDNLLITGLDALNTFNYGPTTPVANLQDRPWIKTDAQYNLIGLYTFAGGQWVTQPLPFTTGDIMMFSGSPSSIVAPWYVCNGQTVDSLVVPDLQGQFIVGVGIRTLPSGSTDTATNYTLGLVGGRETLVLTAPNICAHSHNLQGVKQAPSASAQPNTVIPQIGLGQDTDNPGYVDGGNTTGFAADGVTPNPPLPAQTLPPFYALAFKMYIAP